MKRFLILFLCLVFLISVFAVPAFAATTADAQATSLQSGWTSSYAPSGYTSSWFWRIVSEVDSIASDVASMEIDVGSISTNVSTISTKITSLSSNITDIKTSVGQINTAMSSIKTSVDSVKTAITDLKTTVSGLSGDIGLIEAWTKATMNSASSIASTASTISSTASTISSTASTISSDLSEAVDCLESIGTSNQHIADSHLALHLDSWATDSTYANSWYRAVEADTSTLVNHSTQLRDGSWLTSSGANWFNSIYRFFEQFSEVHADYYDQQIDRKLDDEKEAVSTKIFSSSRTSQINDFSVLEGDLKDFFAMDDVDPGLMFGQIEDGYSSWFSLTTAIHIGRGGGLEAVSDVAATTYGLDRAVYEDPDTPYLDACVAEVERILAGGDPD